MPQVVKWLLAVQTALYLLVLVLGDGETGRGLTAGLALDPARVFKGWFWTPVTYPWFHFRHDLFGFIFDVLILWSLGGLFGRRWRSRHFLFFFVVSAALAGLVDCLLYFAFGDRFAAPVMGTSGSIFALFVAFYFIFGDMRVSILGSSPLKGRTVFYLLAGLEIVLFVAGNNPFFGVQLGGALAGWLLVTGRWRPAKMKKYVTQKLQQIRRRREIQRRKLRIIH